MPCQERCHDKDGLPCGEAGACVGRLTRRDSRPGCSAPHGRCPLPPRTAEPALNKGNGKQREAEGRGFSAGTRLGLDAQMRAPRPSPGPQRAALFGNVTSRNEARLAGVGPNRMAGVLVRRGDAGRGRGLAEGGQPCVWNDASTSRWKGPGQMCPAASSRGRLCATATGHFRPPDCEKANSRCFRLLPGLY